MESAPELESYISVVLQVFQDVAQTSSILEDILENNKFSLLSENRIARRFIHTSSHESTISKRCEQNDIILNLIFVGLGEEIDDSNIEKFQERYLADLKHIFEVLYNKLGEPTRMTSEDDYMSGAFYRFWNYSWKISGASLSLESIIGGLQDEFSVSIYISREKEQKS